MTETQLSSLVKKVTGRPKLEYHPNGKESHPEVVDYTPPSKRISLISGLEEHLRTLLKDESFPMPEDL